MCGVLGVYINDKKNISSQQLLGDLRSLYRLSVSRGRDSSGIAARHDTGIDIYKRGKEARHLCRDSLFAEVVGQAYRSSPTICIGHTRLVTHGSAALEVNNQPIQLDHLVGVHNGIILELPSDEISVHDLGQGRAEGLSSGSDSIQFFRLIQKQYLERGALSQRVLEIVGGIRGTAAIALINSLDRNLTLASNSGSLHYCYDEQAGNLVFTSEQFFLYKFLQNSSLFNKCGEIIQLARNTVITMGASGIEYTSSPTKKKAEKVDVTTSAVIHNRVESVDQLRRCSRCILPATYPFIRFDSEGVCNFCHRYKKQELHGRDELARLLDKYRSRDGTSDCLVGLSGGRDSCYTLHLLKHEFGMNPVAYMYDSGLCSDVARRNQSNLCESLGVELIIRAPSISAKRRYVRKNIEAWLKRPRLGMVPLFIAGDKSFYYYSRQLKKELGIRLSIWGSGQLVEQREFFVSFCGIDTSTAVTARAYDYNNWHKLLLALYYVKEYLLNPAYINESFWDSVWGFITMMLQKDDALYFFEYLPWNEGEIERVLRQHYGWESSASYGSNQWRMGDSQTAFTNYIYHTVAGFSEFDNFRSNQIREGIIDRGEALRLAKRDNEEKKGALEDFARTVGFNIDEALMKINLIPKLYR